MFTPLKLKFYLYPKTHFHEKWKQKIKNMAKIDRNKKIFIEIHKKNLANDFSNEKIIQLKKVPKLDVLIVPIIKWKMNTKYYYQIIYSSQA